jgi:N-acetylglucosaminyl-diphospho-decaprenol L-rhamnosyltransferase
VNAPGTAAVVVSIIVVNYNTARLLEPMRRTLEVAAGDLRLQWIVIDNASRDDSKAALAQVFGDALVIHNTTNVGFGRANNQALPHLHGAFVLLLNTDAFARADALVRSVEYLRANPRCGIVGCRLEGEDGGVQVSCRGFPTPWNVFLNRSGLRRLFPQARMVDRRDWNPAETATCDWVPGCFYLIRREVIDQVGLFDPRFFLYGEEVDHCRRTKQAGWEVAYLASASCVHLGGESAKADGPLDAGRQLSALQVESELLFFRKHHGLAGALAWIALNTVSVALNAVRSRKPGAAARHLLEFARLTLRTAAGARPIR